MPKYYDRDTKVAYVQQIEEGKLKARQAARDLGVAEWITSFVHYLSLWKYNLNVSVNFTDTCTAPARCLVKSWS